MALKTDTIDDNQKRLYSGSWVEGHPLAEKTVVCIKCFVPYVIKDAPRSVPKTDAYYVKEPRCPNCRCRLYFSE